MLTLGPIGFAAPWLLLALPALPVLWWLLRVTPPAPKRQIFPPTRILRELAPQEATPARTPWWLLLLRLLVAALIILGLARPIWQPNAGTGQSGPLLLVLDDSWAAAPDWARRMAAAQGILEAAKREARPVALLATAPQQGEADPLAFLPAEEAAARLAVLRPKPWVPDRAAALASVKALRAANPGGFESLFLTDGLEHGAGEDAAPFLAALAEAGPLTLIHAPAEPRRLLAPPILEGDRLRLKLTQAPVALPGQAAILARGGDGASLARVELALPAGATMAEAVLQLPSEIRNQVVRLELEPEAGAAGVFLLDESFRRRPVGLAAAEDTGADAPLIGPLFYLLRALDPFAELRRGTPEALLARRLSVLILADRELADPKEREALEAWVRAGGTLIRFAGPRLAAKQDNLLPVPLRAGERQLGGMLTWEKPQTLAPFPDHSPFAGLTPTPEVTIERQVLAEPSPRLAERSWARLADGTPLVTAESRGAGRVVLFHITAQAEWSNLPLSGLFVEMLRRLVALSAGVAAGEADQALAPLETLDGFGRLGAPPAGAAPIAARGLDEARASPRNPPGWYGPAGAAGEAAFRRSLNLATHLPAPQLMAAPPASTRVEALGGAAAERDLGPWLLAAALALFLVELIAALGLRGLWRPRRWALPLVVIGALAPGLGMAQGADGSAALATRLAYIVTGDATVDETSRSGLAGLADFVNRRTAAALAEPQGVRPGEDDLSFYPLVYWPILPDAPTPSTTAVAALNDFMRQGGIILMDTRDQGSGEGMAAGARVALRRVTRDLAIPPLVPVPEDHVLNRAFYLLNELPGRFAGGQVWVARDQDRANDSVSPVILGGHDWAAAWAMDRNGQHPHATIPGGARQRVLAYRFGTNLVMYALTGNYKGDQVHVPAILERLGN
ncbi:MAG: hypothetical protein RL724_2482 [Pseudomonadota bacterium]